MLSTGTTNILIGYLIAGASFSSSTVMMMMNDDE